MKKKTRQITNIQFNIGIAIIVILVFAAVYLAVFEGRFTVRESDDLFAKKVLVSPDKALTYKTEFCASKLTDLAHEMHFLGQDIKQQKKIEATLKNLPEMKEEVIEIEQRELEIVENDFNEFKALCDSFDKEPAEELCNEFLNEAKQQLDIAQNNFQDAKNEGILEEADVYLHSLRKTQRIYEGLQKECK